MSDIAIRVSNLGKEYRIGGRQEPYRTLRDTLTDALTAPIRRAGRLLRGQSGGAADLTERFWALKDISFEIGRGEVVGIIGRNGAGKSTLLKILSRITEPTTGRAAIYGRVGSLLEVGTGFHAELTGRDNVYLNGAILGMRRAEIERKFDDIVAFAEVEQFVDTPVKHYSSGMYLRLAFAVAAHLEPEILIVDEVLAVGDAAFQKKCLGKMEDIAHEGRTVLFVSHNMQAIRQMCQRAILLSRGQIAFSGSPSQAITQYFGGEAEHEAAVQLTHLPRRAPPDGAVLRAVRFLNDQGRPRQQFRTEEQLHVQVVFSATRPLARFDIAMALIHGDGTPVFSEMLSDQDEPRPLPTGEYACTFTLDLRYLKLETYFLTLYLLDRGQPLDSVEGIALPAIADPSADPLKETRRWGMVRIPLQWSAPTPTTHAHDQEPAARSH
jgi:lipopolysaccharide transport system ATP-binding protein